MADEIEPSWLNPSEDKKSYPSWLIEDDENGGVIIQGGIVLNKVPSSEEFENDIGIEPAWVHSKESLSPKWTKNDESQRLSEKKTLTSRSILPDDKADLVCCCMDATLCYFRLFHIVCGLVVLLNLVENCLVLAQDFNTNDVRDFVMRVYDVCFCFLCFFIELDFRFVVDSIRIMDNWIFRGLFYIL